MGYRGGSEIARVVFVSVNRVFRVGRAAAATRKTEPYVTLATSVIGDRDAPSMTSHKSSMEECFSTSSILIPFTCSSFASSSAIAVVGAEVRCVRCGLHVTDESVAYTERRE
jgi:hypothetical protein